MTDDEKGGLSLGVAELAGRAGLEQGHACAMQTEQVERLQQRVVSGELPQTGAREAATGAAAAMMMTAEVEVVDAPPSADAAQLQPPAGVCISGNGSNNDTAMAVEGAAGSEGGQAAREPTDHPPPSQALEGGEAGEGGAVGGSAAREQHPTTAPQPREDGTVADISQDPGALTAGSPLTPLIGPPGRLTPSQLAGLSICMADFEAAVKAVQPSAKREGFTTIPDVTWEDVGALGDVRGELEFAISRPIQFPEQYAAMGLRAATGVLLYGPPGCGKTLVAKAIANDAGANFISIKVRGGKGEGGGGRAARRSAVAPLCRPGARGR